MMWQSCEGPKSATTAQANGLLTISLFPSNILSRGRVRHDATVHADVIGSPRMSYNYNWEEERVVGQDDLTERAALPASIPSTSHILPRLSRIIFCSWDTADRLSSGRVNQTAHTQSAPPPAAALGPQLIYPVFGMRRCSSMHPGLIFDWPLKVQSTQLVSKHCERTTPRPPAHVDWHSLFNDIDLGRTS